MRSQRVLIAAGATLLLSTAYFLGYTGAQQGNVPSLISNAVAAEKTGPISPVKARYREVYYPNSEDLAADEMRIVACRTGMPNARPRQAGICFLVELQ